MKNSSVGLYLHFDLQTQIPNQVYIATYLFVTVLNSDKGYYFYSGYVTYTLSGYYLCFE